MPGRFPSSRPSTLRARAARAADAEAIARIYSEGIAERRSTFETRPRTAADVQAWLGGRHPVVVVERAETEADAQVVAFASSAPYSPRACYAGVADFSVYVDSQARGQGAGRLAVEALVAAATAAGFHKLTSRVFATNAVSRRMLAGLGFREVGVHLKHAPLDGVWHDVVTVERLLPENLR
ncbi:N-acetyltransferase [Aggregicoccus sp. 17bor-14]|uniref:arsinothricin resistance N-acetyltransferase ArsN1 family A n=1 Tax=Myxococcaceae TaxID=31 RepID=UPI00129CE59E|nr:MULTISPECIES: arsinothricin resistance N-acetyltransferase ArsN1 family A [Myxococcaceae]MBF5045372.1 N-acetyltransferase [Simulacricoccus sp. 17bor-14]MRI91114.1 N-acetyltransferase [Aggregicoccus sp. 17bor-14]